MECKKCRYCIQVSKNEYKVKCKHDKVSADPGVWVDEPDFCRYYLKKGSDIDKFLNLIQRYNTLKENYENGRIESDDRN